MCRRCCTNHTASATPCSRPAFCRGAKASREARLSHLMVTWLCLLSFLAIALLVVSCSVSLQKYEVVSSRVAAASHDARKAMENTGRTREVDCSRVDGRPLMAGCMADAAQRDVCGGTGPKYDPKKPVAGPAGPSSMNPTRSSSIPCHSLTEPPCRRRPKKGYTRLRKQRGKRGARGERGETTKRCSRRVLQWI